MNISHVSTSTMFQTFRTTVARSQAELIRRQSELTTGRHADVNLTLGPKAGVPIALRTEQDRLSGIVTSNTLVSTRMELTQATLGAVVDDGQRAIDSLTTALGSSASIGVAINTVTTVLQGFTAHINQSDGGQYLFAGINTDVRPLDDFLQDPAGTARNAVVAAFTTEFGFAPDDPAAATIAPAAMEAFLDGAFSQIFTDDAQWQASWSSASDRNIRNRIAPQVTVESGVNANDEGIRSIAAAYSMVVGLGGEGLNAQTLQVVLERALSNVSQGMEQINASRGQLGLVQEQVSVQNEALNARMQINESYLVAIESVDRFEAASIINQLTSQIETSYSMTGRLQSLSLLNYV